MIMHRPWVLSRAGGRSFGRLLPLMDDMLAPKAVNIFLANHDR